MAAPIISLASGVVPEFGPVDTILAAAAGGFDAVGLWVEPPNWTAETVRESVRLAREHSLPILDVEVIWLKAGPLDPDHLRLLDIGMELGAGNALVVSSDPDPDGTIEKFAALCRHVAGTGLRVALEFGMFTEIGTIHQALGVLDAVDHPAAALLIDPLHLSRSGGAPADVARVRPSLFSYAQFCDATAKGPPPEDRQAIITEAIDDRLQVGEGALPLDALMTALPPGIPLSIELRSKALRDDFPDPGERARSVATATRRFIAGRTERAA